MVTILLETLAQHAYHYDHSKKNSNDPWQPNNQLTLLYDSSRIRVNLSISNCSSALRSNNAAINNDVEPLYRQVEAAIAGETPTEYWQYVYLFSVNFPWSPTSACAICL